MSSSSNILVVDDEKSIRNLLCQILSEKGYSCRVAGTSGQALDILGTSSINLVILDIIMPGDSGIELLSQIKTSYPEIAVVMVTAIADTKIAVQCMKNGAHDYITKPFNIDEVCRSVALTIEKKHFDIDNNKYFDDLREKVSEQTIKIRTSFYDSIVSLIYALEAKDKYTCGHSQRVAEIAVAICKHLDLPQEVTTDIKLAGLLHDIGKIGVPESILNKPSRLTEEEFHLVQGHPEIGERILSQNCDIERVLKLVRSHHERFDGNGYPDKLRGTQIPIGARILAVSDAFEAMTSERSYREALDSKTALDEIEHCKGTQFDPELADTFLDIINHSNCLPQPSRDKAIPDDDYHTIDEELAKDSSGRSFPLRDDITLSEGQQKKSNPDTETKRNSLGKSPGAIELRRQVIQLLYGS